MIRRLSVVVRFFLRTEADQTVVETSAHLKDSSGGADHVQDARQSGQQSTRRPLSVAPSAVSIDQRR